MTGVSPFPHRPHLRLVEKPSWQRHLSVRIAASDGRSPIGRSKAFRITEYNIHQLIDHALRLEARR
jgi:hypothetical protein